MVTVPITVGAPPEFDVAFVLASRTFEAVVARVGPDRWDDPSPCAGWTVRDVVSHVVETLDKAAAMAGGRSFDRDPGHPVDAGDDLIEAVRTAAAAAGEVVTGAPPDRPAAGPQGSTTLAAGLAFPTADLAVHAWDVAHATGRPLELPDPLLAHVAQVCGRLTEHQLRGTGLFGPERAAPPGADATTRLIAWLGRDVG